MSGFNGASGVPKKYIDDLVAQSTAKYDTLGDVNTVKFDMDHSSGRMTLYFDDASGNSMRLWLTSIGYILQKKSAGETNWTTLKTV
jgi:hypothetical protein